MDLGAILANRAVICNKAVSDRQGCRTCEHAKPHQRVLIGVGTCSNDLTCNQVTTRSGRRCLLTEDIVKLPLPQTEIMFNYDKYFLPGRTTS
jgi:hypothetical protein